jgi:hypothetical protein
VAKPAAVKVADFRAAVVWAVPVDEVPVVDPQAAASPVEASRAEAARRVEADLVADLAVPAVVSPVADQADSRAAAVDKAGLLAEAREDSPVDRPEMPGLRSSRQCA